MLTTIVIPVYNSQKTIQELADKLLSCFEKSKIQIVLVNDGSTDDSHAKCLELVRAQPSVITYIRLAKNFGEHNAVMAGLHHAEGDYVVIIDDDLQNPPEEVHALVEEAVRGNYDVVYSYYDKKQHSWFRNLGSRFHNWAASRLLDKPKDLYLSSFKCLNSFVVKQVIKYSGPYPYLDGLVLRCTGNIGKVKVSHQERGEGKSGYTLRKLIRLWLNMFLNFSVIPLRLSALIGVAFSAFGFFYGLSVILEKMVRPELPLGWPSIVVLLVTFAGIQLIILGLIGEYIGALFLANNKTPQFVVREVHDRAAGKK